MAATAVSHERSQGRFLHQDAHDFLTGHVGGTNRPSHVEWMVPPSSSALAQHAVDPNRSAQLERALAADRGDQGTWDRQPQGADRVLKALLRGELAVSGEGAFVVEIKPIYSRAPSRFYPANDLLMYADYCEVSETSKLRFLGLQAPHAHTARNHHALVGEVMIAAVLREGAYASIPQSLWKRTTAQEEGNLPGSKFVLTATGVNGERIEIIVHGCQIRGSSREQATLVARPRSYSLESWETILKGSYHFTAVPPGADRSLPDFVGSTLYELGEAFRSAQSYLTEHYVGLALHAESGVWAAYNQAKRDLVMILPSSLANSIPVDEMRQVFPTMTVQEVPERELLTRTLPSTTIIRFNTFDLANPAVGPLKLFLKLWEDRKRESR